MSHATATLPLDELNQIHAARDVAQLEAASYKRELAELRAKVGDGDVPKLIGDLNAAVRSLIKVLRFATGNLSPEVIKGWPSDALREIAVALRDVLPDRTDDDQTLAQLCDAIAEDADKWDRARKAGEVPQHLDNALKELPTLAELQAAYPSR